MKQEAINNYNRIKSKIEEILKTHQEGVDAIKFITAFCTLCHAVDDLIDDEASRSSHKFILKTFALAMDVYSSRFYQNHLVELYPIVSTIHDQYSTCVEYEHSNELWKKDYANQIRLCQSMLPIYIIKMLLGYDASREFSLTLVEYAYHTDNEHAPETNLLNFKH